MASVLSSWARMIVDALVAHGIEPGPVLADAGLSAAAFQDPNARLPSSSIVVLCRRAAEQAGDPAFGLKVSRYVLPTTFHALGLATAASSNLRDALERALRFCQLISDSGTLTLEVEREHARLRVVSHAKDEGCDHFRDAILSMMVRTCRGLTQGKFELEAVFLRRQATTDLAPYRAFFGCPVSLGREDVLSFRASLLALPLETANAELVSIGDAAVRDYLSRARAGTVVDRVRAAAAVMMSASPSPSRVAQRLGMSCRTMQRLLGEHHTSYKAVVASLRFELARAYLAQGELTIAEISHKLGYDNASVFTRAFKRWSGSSPSEYLAV